MAVAFDMAFDVQTKLNTATYGCTVAFDMVSSKEYVILEGKRVGGDTSSISN